MNEDIDKVPEEKMFYGKVVELTDQVVCNDGITFHDYSWEEHKHYLGFGVPKDINEIE